MEQFTKNHAGLIPSYDTNNRPFKVDLERTKNFLQNKRFSLAAREASKKNGIDLNFKIELYVTKVSDEFYPIVLRIPDDAIEDIDTSNMDPIFAQAISRGNRPRILKDFYKYMELYMFTDEDRTNIETAEWKHKHDVYRTEQKNILKFTKPAYFTRKEDKDTQSDCIVLLDPLKIFWDMLDDTEIPKDANPEKIENILNNKSKNIKSRKKFRVGINYVRRVGGTNYIYEIRQEFGNSKNSKRNKRVNDDLGKALAMSQSRHFKNRYKRNNEFNNGNRKKKFSKRW